jgi:hypothetical protein
MGITLSSLLILLLASQSGDRHFEVGQRWLYQLDGKESASPLIIIGAGIHPRAGAGFDIQIASLPLSDGSTTTVLTRISKAALDRSVVRLLEGTASLQSLQGMPEWNAESWIAETTVEEALRIMQVGIEAARNTSCEFDRGQMLALDQQAFDQDIQGGWRKLARNPKCLATAANLIREYREHHRSDAPILFWHEGQLRAELDQYSEAIALFEKSRKSKPDGMGWNEYVDASIAFLRGDRAAFDAARNALAALPRPANFDLRDRDGREVPWPMNLNVVDSLGRCFGRPYGEAYGRCLR